jgi:exonuclease III
VKNKTLAVADFIQSHNADLLATTEIWLGSGIDKSAISDITPQGYGIHHVSRHGRKEGSVALVYNSNIEVKSIRNEDKWSNFELLECSVTHRNVESRIVVIYRLPPSNNNNFRVWHFFEEFSSFVQKAADSPDDLIITGDFNFHLDDPNDSNSRTFLEILDEHSLS